MVNLARGAVGAAFIALLAFACSRPNDEAVKAPEPQPPQTSDGRVVGADGKSPEQTLSEGPTTAHPAPGWKLDGDGISYDPKRRSGEDHGSLELADAGADAASR